jgi:hypothetical protein
VRLLDYAYTADEVGMSVKDSKQTVFRRKHLLEKFVNGHSQWVAHPVTDAISKSSWCFDLNGKMVAPGDHHENKIEWYQEHGQSAPITIARRAGDIASCIVPKSSYNTLV